MKKVWIVAIALLSLAFLVFAALFFIGYFKPKPGGILVTTTPASSVFVNGDLVGKTPYEGTFRPGEFSIKLVPESGEKNLLPFETRVSLVSGVKTVVRREFGETEETSSGEIISFEKEDGKGNSLIVISTPDNAQVSIDGTPKGFAPYKISTITPGEHQISIKAVGFLERILTVKSIPGYRLSIIASLAKEEVKPEEVAGATTEIKTFVEILETPTGFLRVRTLPGSGGSEIHQVKPGEKYLFLEEDSATGWFKIQVQDPAPGLPNGIMGWVSNEFSRKIDEEVTLPDSPPATF
jgi:hypothetical protein